MASGNDETALQPYGPLNETTIFTKAGFWPWLSGLFAFLWIITLVLLLRKKGPLPSSVDRQESNTTPSGLEAMRTAVISNDAVKVATALRLWDRSLLPEALNKEIEQEVTALMASRYSSSIGEWQNHQLLLLLKRAGQHSKLTPKQEVLSDLY
ncbi:hypothetical protein [Grimontia sp. NTOU-MAR1]|uniref:hypothetical protein n=1 Tax=Grimontia sp. NTOU-MAR1 TaxID=3111011 RepID=UPI002DB5F435|nr:hypothetical protein [Grimontia sp. NTOU-MAR1]WRV99100.1 hypothetical protein VP504_06700 [Grimontia sp. NTOU-MAR1]